MTYEKIIMIIILQQDRINRQVLHINKLEKTHTEDEDEFMDDEDDTATEDQADETDAPQPDVCNICQSSMEFCPRFYHVIDSFLSFYFIVYLSWD